MIRSLRENPDFIAMAVLSLILGLGQRTPVADRISHRITEVWGRAPRVTLDYEPPEGRCTAQRLADYLRY